MPREKTPKVSVVLPVYNADAYVGEVLVTILEQSFTDFEVIIIDDGSRDASAKVVKRYAKMDERIKCHYQKNRGGDKLGTTLNYGVSLARGELIARADSDDPWMLDRLEKQVTYMEKHPKCVVCGGGAEIIDTEGRHVWTFIVPSSDEDMRRTMPLYTPLNHGGVIFRKEAFLKAGEYVDIKYAEDFDLWVRMSRLGEMHNLPEAVFKYRKNEKGISLSHEAEQKTAVAKIGREYWDECKPEFFGVGAIRKKVRDHRDKKNGGALSWVFIEDTLTIAGKYMRWDGDFLKGVTQMVAVALSGKLGMKLFLKKLFSKHGQKIRFVMVGAINTVCDMFLFLLFANVLGIYIIAANIFSTGITLILSFILNYSFVWRSKKSKLSTAPKFLVSTLFTAWGVQNAVIWLATTTLGGRWIFEGNDNLLNIVAKICAIGIGMVINYLVYKLIFTEKKEDK